MPKLVIQWKESNWPVEVTLGGPRRFCRQSPDVVNPAPRDQVRPDDEPVTLHRISGFVTAAPNWMTRDLSVQRRAAAQY